MSLAGWRRKHFSSFEDWSAEFRDCKNHELKRRALAHALKKWEGLRHEALEQEGLVHIGRNVFPVNLAPAEALASGEYFPVDMTTCTLCTFYSEKTNELPDCSNCPLFELRGAACSVAVYPEPAPFYVWVRCGNAEPMIELIKRAIKALPKKGAR